MDADGVFDGGGVKCIALVGALKRAEEEGILFKRVGGTSGGAIVASFYAAGYNVDELKEIMKTTDFKQFMDTEPDIISNYGIYRGEIFYEWIKTKLKGKGIMYFEDLKIPLRVVVSDITNKRIVIFDSEKHKNMEVAKTIRMSVGMPIIFRPYKWFDYDLNIECLMVDGGLISNYPINIFDDIPNRKTYGFRLTSPEEIQKPEPITNMFSYFRSIIDTMMTAHEKIYIEKTNLASTISIPIGNIGTTKFNLSEQEKEWLYDVGYKATEKYFIEQKGEKN